MDPVSGIGLAAATIELTSAAFKCYCQIRDLHKAIKFSERDLTTAKKKLEQHESFIEELRVNFERTSNSSISTHTRSLFQDCLAESKAEVEEFKDLLKHVGKQRFAKKAFQAIETGARLRLSDDSIRRYHGLLESQMQRFAFLQSSLQSHATTRLESSVSNIEALIVQQGAIATALYSSVEAEKSVRRKQLTPVKTSPKHGQTSSLFLDHNTTMSQWHDTIFASYSLQRRSYYTLGGVVSVSTSPSHRDNTKVGKANNTAKAFQIVFEPYSWISNAYVEWRCIVPSTECPMWIIGSSTSVVCDDDDVFDALGLIRRSRLDSSQWTAKMPNSSKVRRLLDTGRLLKEHVIRLPNKLREYSVYRDVLTAYVPQPYQFRDVLIDERSFIDYHKPCRCEGYADFHGNRDFINRPEDQSFHENQAQVYIEVCEIIGLLLCRSFKPHLSSWQLIYDHAAKDHWHAQNHDAHRELWHVMETQDRSIPRLIIEACGHPIAMNPQMSFHERQRLSCSSIKLTWFVHNYGIIWSEATSTSHPNTSYLGHLITSKHSRHGLKEIEDLGIDDLADDEFTFDRWLIVLYASIEPEVDIFLRRYITAYRSPAARLLFTEDHVYREIQQAPQGQSECLISFVSSHGAASLLQRLNLLSSDSGLATWWQICAAQSQNPSSLDLLIGKGTCDVEILPHTTGVIERVVRDPIFAADLVAHCLSRHGERGLFGGAVGPFVAFLSFGLSFSSLMMDEIHPLPEYMWIHILGFLKRHEVDRQVKPYDVHNLVFKAMEYHWDWNAGAKDLLRNLHFYKVPRLVVHSPAFQSLIDASEMGSWQCLSRLSGWMGDPMTASPYARLDGLSALMLALHCGMKPAVDILVEAGASITKPAACGKSALQFARKNAQANHPRQCISLFDTHGKLVDLSMDRKYSREKRFYEPLWVPESTDREMLEILLQALRDRGEEIIEVAVRPPPSRLGMYVSAYLWKRIMTPDIDMLKSKSRRLTKWLFKPRYEYDAEALRENIIYVLLVTVLSLFSTLKVLKSEFGDSVASIARLLSRPVVLLALFAWFLSVFFRSTSK
ncbi:hypothetical protein F5Y18DRAFT_418704 [Xylariaceae sp. FL1019]|nr:hypothetical protein F5Y18DRAFT_418704 [Xylariaceae sp. FL1019]